MIPADACISERAGATPAPPPEGHDAAEHVLTGVEGGRASRCAHATSTSLYGGLLARCDWCGLVRTARDPRFVYDESYFVTDAASGYDFDSVYARVADEERFAAELDRLEAQGLGGRLLDIGCATGAFLAIARTRGWDAIGVEVAEFARREAERRSGARVFASLDELPAQAAFDVVTLHHVLEHIAEPADFLAGAVRPRVARRLLVEVPNFASLASRAHGAAWQDLRPEQHVTHFTPATLAATVESAGFRVRDVYTLWAPVWSLAAARSLARWLPHLLDRDASGAAARGRARVTSGNGAHVAAWRPPRGAWKVLTEASRVACAPLVRALERRGFAERLVVEADLAPRPSSAGKASG